MAVTQIWWVAQVCFILLTNPQHSHLTCESVSCLYHFSIHLVTVHCLALTIKGGFQNAHLFNYSGASAAFIFSTPLLNKI